MLSTKPPSSEPIDVLGFSVRTYNCLRRARIDTVGQLLATPSGVLAEIPNFGAKSLNEVCRAIEAWEEQRHADSTPIESDAPVGVAADTPAAGGPATPLNYLGLSVRPHNVLLNAGVHSVEALVSRTADQIRVAPNLGTKSFDEIVAALASKGLALAENPGPVRHDSDGTTLYHEELEVDTGTRASGGRDPRIDQMVEMRREGKTLDEIGRHFGVTRERVRQITKSTGVSFEEAAAARRENELELVRKHLDELLARYRRGDDMREFASEIGASAAAVEEVLRDSRTSADSIRRRRSQPRGNQAKVYSDLDLIEAIQAVTDHLGRTPASGEYAKVASEFGLPSLPTIGNRFGTWVKAVTAAGLEPAQGARRAYTRRWTEDACEAALERVVLETGHVPSANEYDEIAQLDDALPSLATVRNRLGRWTVVMSRIAELPDASTVVARLGITGADPDGESDEIWLAYLDEDLTNDDLKALLVRGAFRWDASFGEAPTELTALLTLLSGERTTSADEGNC